MELTVAGGYFQPGKTPQIINKVNELITLGYVPYGTPTYNEASGWVSQLMVLGYGGSATDYTLTTGYLDKTPYFPNKPPVNGNWVLLGSLLARSNNFYVHAWLDGVAAGPAIDLANTVGNLPLDRTTGTLDFGTRVTGNVPLASRVSGTLPIANGGTGATTAAAAWTALGGGSIGKLNSVSLTANVSGTLPIANGGTNSTTAAAAWTALGGGSIGKLNSVSLTANVSGTLPIANGGTGATTYAAARTALGVDRLVLTTAAAEVAVLSVNSSNKIVMWGSGNTVSWGCVNTSGVWTPLPVDRGGTGATNAADARANLGAAAASDSSIKHDIQAYDGLQSLANIEAIIPRTFIFNNDPLNRVRRGVIAQEMQDIDPEYATRVTRSRLNDDGIHVTTEDILILDNNALLVDALIAIKVLAARVAELEEKLK